MFCRVRTPKLRSFAPKFTNLSALFHIRCLSSKLQPKPRFGEAIYQIPLYSEEEIEDAMKVEDLAKIEEYTKAALVAQRKPEKAQRYIKTLLKKLRTEYIGLPVYNHLLETHAKFLMINGENEEAELQLKN